MEHLFIRKPTKTTNDEDLSLQILTWRGYDSDERYTITFCGVTANGKTVGVTVNDFDPHFYLQVPVGIRWTKSHLSVLEKHFRGLLHAADLSEDFTLDTARRKVLYPFTDGKQFLFIKVSCVQQAAMKKLFWSMKRPLTKGPFRRTWFNIYEADIDPILRFCHRREIHTSGWVTLPAGSYDTSNEYSRCQINVLMRTSKSIVPVESLEIAPLVIASYDIETDSAETRSKNAHLYPEQKDKCRCVFPDQYKAGDAIKVVCTTLKIYGTENILRHAIVWGDCDESKIPSADVLVKCASEKELLQAWLDMVRLYDPDILIGYNLYGFDDRYMWHRMVELFDMEPQVQLVSRVKDIECCLKDSKLVTSAYGTNFFKIFDIPGVYKIDLYVYMKKEEKLDSYKLNSVAEKFLGVGKIDLPPLDLFYYMNGTPQQMSECVEYCVQDTILPIQILEHRKILVNLMQMANITRVPIEWLITKGQQIKVFSQLTYECRLEGVLVPTNTKKQQECEKFVGATVLQPIKGYYKEPIAGLDFASLYPSIMISDNLCYSTFIPEAKLSLYEKRPDLEILNIRWQEDPPEDEEYDEADLAKYSFHFVQNKEGILPRILNKLWKTRKAAKKDMKRAKECGDTNLADVLNGKQLAIKVTMNSVYGFTGATNGYMPMKIIASSVTARGRQLIDQTKSFCESNYDCEVIYGDTDSCYVKFNHGDPKDPDYMRNYFKLCEEAAAAVTREFKKPVELEFEKVMQPTLLFAKKRYACKVWTNPETHDYIDCKGIQIVRRDNCQYVKEVSQRILDKIMLDDDIDGAIQVADESVMALLYNQVDPTKLILSKTLRTGYKCGRCHKVESGETRDICRCPEGPKISLPHVQLVMKEKRRNAVEIPQPGDRVPYFFTEGTGLQCERVENPAYINKANPEGKVCRPDPLYYLQRQLKQPIITLLELVMPDTSLLFENGPCEETIDMFHASQKEADKAHKERAKVTKYEREIEDAVIRKLYPSELV